MEKPQISQMERGRPERYALERVTVEMLSKPREMPGKMNNFSWPIELQGKGSTDEKEKTMLVRFPKGDIFLSFVITIHELGHLRQEELDSSLRAEPQTHQALLAQEQDAWERGWDRFSASNLELLHSLEERFYAYRIQGKMTCDSFIDLYEWVHKNVLRMVDAQRILFEESGEETPRPNEERFDQLADELEKAGIRDFLDRIEKNRVGEVVDEREIREAITRTLERVIKE